MGVMYILLSVSNWFYRLRFHGDNVINLSAGDIFIMDCSTVHSGGSYIQSVSPSVGTFMFLETTDSSRFRTSGKRRRHGIILLAGMCFILLRVIGKSDTCTR